MGLKLFDWERDFYPAPKRRRQNPDKTEFVVGDVVKPLIGPAKGRIGVVVVERNGNYEDSEPYVDEEAIGVGVAEDRDLDPTLVGYVQEVVDVSPVRTVTRWFDSPDQLEVIERAPRQ